MTKDDLVELPQLMNLRHALELAFDAGAAHRLGQFNGFKQIHMDADEVAKVLTERVEVKP
jgi:hypothetical protein